MRADELEPKPAEHNQQGDGARGVSTIQQQAGVGGAAHPAVRSVCGEDAAARVSAAAAPDMVRVLGGDCSVGGNRLPDAADEEPACGWHGNSDPPVQQRVVPGQHRVAAQQVHFYNVALYQRDAVPETIPFRARRLCVIRLRCVALYCTTLVPHESHMHDVKHCIALCSHRSAGHGSCLHRAPALAAFLPGSLCTLRAWSWKVVAVLTGGWTAAIGVTLVCQVQQQRVRSALL